MKKQAVLWPIIILTCMIILSGCKKYLIEEKRNEISINTELESPEEIELPEEIESPEELESSEEIDQKEEGTAEEVITEKEEQSNLTDMGINPLYCKFLYSDISVPNPYTQGMEGYNQELNFFDDEDYETEFKDNEKTFALVDIDSDKEKELVFQIVSEFDELIYLLGIDNEELICIDIFESHSRNSISGNTWLEQEYGINEIEWLKCDDFSDIPSS